MRYVTLLLIAFIGVPVTGLAGAPAPALPAAASFQQVAAGLTPYWYGSAAWGDYDNDDDLDLLAAGSRAGGYFVAIYRNDGAVFTETQAGMPQTGGGYACFGDYDRDGDLDVLHLLSAGSRILRNDSGLFVDLGIALPSVPTYSGGAWGDFDGDGDLDVAMGAGSFQNVTARVLRNDGGVHVDVGPTLPAFQDLAIGWIDSDRDGDLDLALVSGASSRVYRNDAGAWTGLNPTLKGFFAASLSVGDYDNDGYSDLAILGNDGFGPFAVSDVYRGTGAAFALTETVLPLERGVATWGDADQDGDLDLLAAGGNVQFGANSPPVSRLYLNEPGDFVVSGVPITGMSYGSGAWGDYDGDGDLDFVLTGAGIFGSTLYASLYRNTGATVNLPPSPPSGLSVEIGATEVTFQWSPSSDDHTPAAGLTYNLRVGTSPGGTDRVSPQSNPATGFRRVPAHGNVGNLLEWTMTTSALGPGPYYWSVQAIDHSYQGSPFAPEEAILLGVDDAGAARTSLRAPAPNPFVAETRLHFDLASPGRVELDVFDAQGRHVAVVASGHYSAGAHSAKWNGRDARGGMARAGVYLVRLRAGDAVLTSRVLRLL